MNTRNIRPEVISWTVNRRPERIRLKKGGLVRHAERLQGAGRYGDRHLVHLNDDEIRFLENKWGPATRNPDTGLREYFLGSLWSGVKDVLSIAQPVLDAVGSVLGMTEDPGVNASGYRMTGAGPGSSGSMASSGGGGTSGVLGDSTMFNIGSSPVSLANLLDLGGIGLSTYGALRQNQNAQKQQDKLDKQWEAQQAKNNETIDYDLFSNRATPQMVGLAPNRPSDLAGFGPEQPLVQRTPAMARGGMAPGYAMGGSPYDMMPTNYDAGGQVGGQGDGQSDQVPAYLSRDEYVLPADVVSHLGNGSSSAGAQKVDAFIDHLRKTRTGNTRFPPNSDGILRQLANQGNPTESELGRGRYAGPGMPTERDLGR